MGRLSTTECTYLPTYLQRAETLVLLCEGSLWSLCGQGCCWRRQWRVISSSLGWSFLISTL